MFRIKNLEEVKRQFAGLTLMMEEVKSSDGQNIVKIVKNSIKPEGPPISEESDSKGNRPALFEAVYRGESSGEEKNAKDAQEIMTQDELLENEQEVIDRFARDFLKHIARGI